VTEAADFASLTSDPRVRAYLGALAPTLETAPEDPVLAAHAS
jgi:hypothetical protein